VSRRWVRWGVPLAVVLIAVAVAVPMTVRSIPGPPDGQTWVATLATIRRLHDQDDAVVAQFFERPTSFALGGYNDAVPGASWASEAQFEADLAAGAIPAGTRAVMYDPERWADTPVVEQRDPVTAIRAFAAAARAAGYQVIVTPHPNLVGVPRAVCGPHKTESLEDAFLRCGITAAAARVADVVEVQAQYLEADPTRYADVVGGAVEQARAANPAALVISGLSTRFASTPQTLVDAWMAVRGIVDGHYMAVPEGIRPEVATEFLRQIGASGT
jgi:hypothetical protein